MATDSKRKLYVIYSSGRDEELVVGNDVLLVGFAEMSGSALAEIRERIARSVPALPGPVDVLYWNFWSQP